MKAKQIEANNQLFNISVNWNLEIIDQFIGYSVKVHSTTSK